MSVGELINLYKGGELTINPAYQRYFRWNDSQKTSFIESLLLGIPTPPIFVFQQEGGAWELIDGLQRVSTILEFVGFLRAADNNLCEPSVMEGTSYVPALAGVRWNTNGSEDCLALSPAQKLDLKRCRVRVEILTRESDEDAKFDLFQRLNTGGSILSPQEVRNCVVVMVKPSFHDWLRQLANSDSFKASVVLSRTKIAQQQDMEVVLRFIAYRRRPYAPGLDVNQYLDQAALKLTRGMTNDDCADEQDVFDRSFSLLASAMGEDAFKKWNGTRHLGGFLISGFDAIAHGVACNQKEIAGLSDPKDWVRRKARAIWAEREFQKHSGMGVRGTARLKFLLPFGEKYFRP